MPVIGPRPLLTCGALITAAGVAWLSELPAQPAYLAHVLGAISVAGTGMGLMVLPATATATSDVTPADARLASGLVNMSRQIGGACHMQALEDLGCSP
jgi:hypothetical protein